MNLNRSGEDYLKAILILQKKNGEVHSSEVASCLNVTRPSTSKAVRLLKDGGFLTMDKSKKISLTDLGRQVAEEILEKHCVIRDVLILFGIEPETAEQDACRIEHDVSRQTFDRMKAFRERQGKEEPQ